MDYRKIYDDLINKAKTREVPEGYFERHHIVPRSLGGSDASENLVKLTAREHFVAHALLVKFTSGADRYKMANALWIMCKRKAKQKEDGYTPASRLYEMSRYEHSIAVSKNMKGTAHALGFKHSEEECKRRSERMRGNSFNLGRKQDPSVGKKISKSKMNKKRGEFSEEWRANLSKSALLRAPPSEETLAKLSKANSGSRNAMTRKYLIIAPTGESFVWLNGLTQFCKDFNISKSRLGIYVNKGIIPPSGKIGRPSSEQSRNADGWKVEYYGGQ